MANPFTYTTTPQNRKQAQENINYWCFEGMLTTEEIEELGYVPASYKSFIKEMKRDCDEILKRFV